MKQTIRVFTIFIFAFLYIPILLLVVASFNSGSDMVVFKGFTLYNYSELFADGTLLPLLKNSLILAAISSVVATMFGTLAAIGIQSLSPRLRSLVMSITNVPLTNPDIVTGVSLALLFAFVGQVLKTEITFGFTTLLIAHITFNLPYVILSVLPKLRQMDPTLWDAALDLGCKPAQAFFKVTIYEILPGIISGLIMAFTMSLDDFVISYFVYGPNFATLPVEIYNYVKKPLPPKIYALFTLMFFAILIMMSIMNLVQGREDKRRKNKLLLPR
jgi:spermidine/putrescine transport system permease protein